MGTLLPLLLAYAPGIINRCRVRLASILVILGGFAQVTVIIIGGQAFPLQMFPGMDMTSSFFDGEVHAYVPTMPELVLGLGGIAIALLIVLIGASFLRFLPVSLAEGGTETVCCKK